MVTKESHTDNNRQEVDMNSIFNATPNSTFGGTSSTPSSSSALLPMSPEIDVCTISSKDSAHPILNNNINNNNNNNNNKDNNNNNNSNFPNSNPIPIPTPTSSISTPLLPSSSLNNVESSPLSTFFNKSIFDSPSKPLACPDLTNTPSMGFHNIRADSPSKYLFHSLDLHNLYARSPQLNLHAPLISVLTPPQPPPGLSPRGGLHSTPENLVFRINSGLNPQANRTAPNPLLNPSPSNSLLPSVEGLHNNRHANKHFQSNDQQRRSRWHHYETSSEDEEEDDDASSSDDDYSSDLRVGNSLMDTSDGSSSEDEMSNGATDEDDDMMSSASSSSSRMSTSPAILIPTFKPLTPKKSNYIPKKSNSISKPPHNNNNNNNNDHNNIHTTSINNSINNHIANSLSKSLLPNNNNNNNNIINKPKNNNINNNNSNNHHENHHIDINNIIKASLDHIQSSIAAFGDQSKNQFGNSAVVSQDKIGSNNNNNNNNSQKPRKNQLTGSTNGNGSDSSANDNEGVPLADGVAVKKRKKNGVDAGRWCHQCKALKFEFIQCQASDAGRPKCNKRFCSTCLTKHYNKEVAVLKQRPKPWVCPFCKNTCICAACKRRRQQPQ